MLDAQGNGSPDSLHLKDHACSCRECEEQLAAMRSVGNRLRALPQTAAPDSLHAFLQTELSKPREASRRTVLVPAAAVAFVLLAGVLTYVLRFAAAGESAIPEYLADYAKRLEAEASDAINTSDPTVMEQWLDARLEFSPFIPRWQWAEFQSAQACTIRDTRISLIKMQCNERDVLLYVHPILQPAISHEQPMQMPHTASSGALTVTSWLEGQLEYTLIYPSEVHDQIQLFDQ
jgi:hypothetical protein